MKKNRKPSTTKTPVLSRPIYLSIYLNDLTQARLVDLFSSVRTVHLEVAVAGDVLHVIEADQIYLSIEDDNTPRNSSDFHRWLFFFLF